MKIALWELARWLRPLAELRQQLGLPRQASAPNGALACFRDISPNPVRLASQHHHHRLPEL